MWVCSLVYVLYILVWHVWTIKQDMRFKTNISGSVSWWCQPDSTQSHMMLQTLCAVYLLQVLTKTKSIILTAAKRFLQVNVDGHRIKSILTYPGWCPTTRFKKTKHSWSIFIKLLSITTKKRPVLHSGVQTLLILTQHPLSWVHAHKR